MIPDPDHFFSCDPRSVIRTIFSMIRSASDQIISLVITDDDNIADRGSFLRITDHFADRGLFDVVEK